MLKKLVRRGRFGHRRMSAAELDKTIRFWLENRKDDKAKNLLAMNYWGLAWYYAKRFARIYRMDKQDMFCLALEGMANGLKNYSRADYVYGHKLTTFVANSMGWVIMKRVPALRYRIALPVNHIGPKISKAIDKLGLDHPLTERSLLLVAEYLNEPPAKVVMIYHAMQTRDVTQGTPVRAVSMGLDATVEDRLESEWPSPEDFANLHGVRRQITRVLLTLRAREERIVRMYYGIGCDEHNLGEIGDMFNLSRERIRQMLLKAMRKLKHPSRLKRLVHHTPFDSYDYKTFELHRRKMMHMDEQEQRRYLWYCGNPADMFELRFGHLPYQG